MKHSVGSSNRVTVRGPSLDRPYLDEAGRPTTNSLTCKAWSQHEVLAAPRRDHASANSPAVGAVANAVAPEAPVRGGSKEHVEAGAAAFEDREHAQRCRGPEGGEQRWSAATLPWFQQCLPCR